MINKLIDHTALKPNTRKNDIDKLLSEAKEYDFKSVCVNPYWVNYCAKALEGSDVLVCTVIGFPLGANTLETKAFETENALKNGADEIDMVINVAALKDGDYDYVVKEIKTLKEICGSKTLKVIIETCLLTDEEKKLACKAILEAKADFVKTSTGFSTGGATKEDIALLKSVVKDNCFIKASGGIRSLNDLEAMVENGANRIGASAGVKIMEEANK